MCVSSCLVSSLFRILPHFLRLFSLLGCYYILHTIKHTYNHTYTDLPWRCFLSSSVDCDFFPVILLVFFCCCATTAVLHLYTHFPCLSILFLSNMLLADTLFSSLSPFIFAVTAAALFRCVSISVSSLCHADNYFALTLNLSNRAQIGTDSTQTIAVAFTATVVCEGHLLCTLCTNTPIRLIR